MNKKFGNKQIEEVVVDGIVEGLMEVEMKIWVILIY